MLQKVVISLSFLTAISLTLCLLPAVYMAVCTGCLLPGCLSQRKFTVAETFCLYFLLYSKQWTHFHLVRTLPCSQTTLEKKKGSFCFQQEGKKQTTVAAIADYRAMLMFALLL